MSTLQPVLLSLALLLLGAGPALAYIGPGAGITMIGALIGVVMAVLGAVAAILFWPIRAFLRSRKAKAGAAAEDTAQSD